MFCIGVMALLLLCAWQNLSVAEKLLPPGFSAVSLVSSSPEDREGGDGNSTGL